MTLPDLRKQAQDFPDITSISEYVTLLNLLDQKHHQQIPANDVDYVTYINAIAERLRELSNKAFGSSLKLTQDLVSLRKKESDSLETLPVYIQNDIKNQLSTQFWNSLKEKMYNLGNIPTSHNINQIEYVKNMPLNKILDQLYLEFEPAETAVI